jgi:hypothetical protein
MYKDQGNESILALIKETADGFGHLLADHIKLARLELVADVKSYGRQVALIALIVPILFMGYAIVCVACGINLPAVFARVTWQGTAR